MPVPSLWMVTVAPGTALPWASVTTPLMVARSERCARSGLLNASTQTGSETDTAEQREGHPRHRLPPDRGRICSRVSEGQTVLTRA